LQEISPTTTESEPTLLLAVEEPELYQHPPQCRHMSKVLEALASGNSQVVITTHSPLFVPGHRFANVRLVLKNAAKSEANVSFVPVDLLAARLAGARGEQQPDAPAGILAKIHQALQPALNEIFFTPYLVLVEGREDAAYILTYMNLMGKADDLRRVGCHIVPADRKSSLMVPLAIVTELGIPTFLVFDADTHAPDKNGAREMHRKDNLALLRLAKVADPIPLPAETMRTDRVVMWATECRLEIEKDFPAEDWRQLSEETEARFGHVGGLTKNPLFIAERLEAAWTRGLRSGQLEDLCNRILDRKSVV
jgi:predicted ATP-dependent endonuclease of OLD family